VQTGSLWRVITTTAADLDIEKIHDWTERRFGTVQADAYAETIADALVHLSAGPSAIGVRDHGVLHPGIYTLHLSRFRRRARHLLVFRASSALPRTVSVLRVLHEAMDLARHLPPGDPQQGDRQ
jgi:toxin ParE1/3/4